MSLFGVLTRLPALLLLALCLSGCFLPYEGPAEEEKDPHYLSGKKRLSNLDYDGAIAAFENALVSNPKSAAAHLELGFLYEERKNQYGAAIYHFERHLELKPESNLAESVKQHIVACKLELAKTVPFLVNRQVQDELRRVNSSNTFLLQLVDQLKTQLVAQATIYSNNLAAVTQAAAQERAQTRAQFAADLERRQSVPSERRQSVSERPAVFSPITTPPSTPRTFPSTPRTHLVRPRETFASISKRYNIRITSLQAANPSIEPRRLKAGQILNLPNSGR
jgi:LysM repeat protein